MAPVNASDGPWASGVVRTHLQRVIPSLPLRFSDWMDRGEIDDIESHVFNVRKPALGIPEGAAFSRLPSLGTDKELIPGAEPCGTAVHQDFHNGGVGNAVKPRLKPAHMLQKLF